VLEVTGKGSSAGAVDAKLTAAVRGRSDWVGRALLA
jgi:hypothetical protein